MLILQVGCANLLHGAAKHGRFAVCYDLLLLLFKF